MYDYTVSSTKSVEELRDALIETVPTVKFGVLWELDLKATLIKKGLDYDKKSLIFEVCSPAKAKALLEHNQAAIYFLPCKVAIYEGEGVTHIGLPLPTTQARLLEDKKLEEMAKEVEDVLIGVIDQIK
ncbi:uncharacterized protein (DUF302 family) [Streptohalobacillus salinus]|uniref:Uncharacterized protein (DUF302 family) n=1 Tax=Streptohalobacillus salinus TaxID=621096 RepID=A0A2V3WDU1_9BACI|nr:DUF302 domain-containing protein [Streptohalobacillus salinus]PXW92713.1 uncharacterized protein (DUF302 family) [Streptohalobacillus salinus]